MGLIDALKSAVGLGEERVKIDPNKLAEFVREAVVANATRQEKSRIDRLLRGPLNGLVENALDSGKNPIDALATVMNNEQLQKIVGKDPGDAVEDNPQVLASIQAIENAEKGKKIESAEATAASVLEKRTRSGPIRNTQKPIGRNEPCPCCSGRKFKDCHRDNRQGLDEVLRQKAREKRDAEKLQKHE
jgi:hypothetical protein